MAHELEAAQLDAAGGWLRRRRRGHHEQLPGTPCANCATPLQGPWCHACGQLGEDFHRSWFRLLGESIEGVLHFDGRVWTTLPDLVLRPGRLTRRYLEGHRAPQVPPLRLFLVVLLLLFFVGSLTGGTGSLFGPPARPAKSGGQAILTGPVAVKVADLTPAERANLKGVIESAKAGKLTVEQQAEVAKQLSAVKVRPMTDADLDKIKSPININISDDKGKALSSSVWLRERVARLRDHPGEFKLVLEAWSERFAFLMLPIAALLMGLLFVFQRRFYIFDHLVFSMHSLSFQGLLITVYMVATGLIGDWADWLLFVPPLHLFIHMRGVYQTSIFGTIARMALLFVGSLIGFVFLMIALVFVGLAGLEG